MIKKIKYFICLLLVVVLLPLQVYALTDSKINHNTNQLDYVNYVGQNFPLGIKDKAPPPGLKSTLFKSDPQAQAIFKSSTSIDLTQEELYPSDYSVYIQSLPYKIFVGLHMIGYQNQGTAIRNAKSIFLMLERFQEKNNLPVSAQFDKKTLVALDNQVYAKEIQIQGYSKKAGTIYESVSPEALKFQFSKDYIGWIFTFPLERLPSNLTQNLTAGNYFMCLFYQCTGAVKKSDKTNYPDNSVVTGTYSEGNFIFYPDIIPSEIPVNSSVSIQKSTGMVENILHEYAHYLDGSVKRHVPVNLKTIDTEGFHSISFFKNEYGFFTECNKRKTDNRKDFISKYGFDADHRCEEEGEGYASPYEDFADSFAAYVLAGKTFRSAAKQNVTINKKYLWLKNNAFMGQEYDTDLPFGKSYAYSGCADADDTDPAGGPFYLSCNDNYTWDGTIRTVLNYKTP